MRYVDCMITIRGKAVEFKPPYSKKVMGDLCYSEVAVLTIKHLNTLVDQKEECTVGLLKLLGMHLYGILFGSPMVREAFEAAYKDFADEFSRDEALQSQRSPGGASDLRFRLNLLFAEGDSELAQLPWEFLFVPISAGTTRGAFALNGSFFTGQSKELILTRRLSEKDQAIDPLREALRILVVCSQPSDLDDIQTEAQAAIAVIRNLGADKSRRVEVQEVEVPTFDNVRTAIEGWQPHVLHFIGHGKKGELAFLRDPKDIDLDDETPESETRPNAHWVSSNDIMGLFARRGPRMVFLHACNSASSVSASSIWTSTPSLTGLMDMARTIVVGAGVPVVIAMQYVIRSADARLFVKEFYEQIAAGKEIDEAATFARYRLGQGTASMNFRRFGTPVVYLHSRDTLILPMTTASSTATEVTARAGAPAPSAAATIRGGAAPAGIADGVKLASGAAPGLTQAAPPPGEQRPPDVHAPATLDRFDSKF